MEEDESPPPSKGSSWKTGRCVIILGSCSVGILYGWDLVRLGSCRAGVSSSWGHT